MRLPGAKTQTKARSKFVVAWLIQSSCGSAIDTHSVRKKMITAGHQLCLPDASTATPAIKAPTVQISMTRRLGGSNIVTPTMSGGSSASASTLG
jgi:hypothetical protein